MGVVRGINLLGVVPEKTCKYQMSPISANFADIADNVHFRLGRVALFSPTAAFSPGRALGRGRRGPGNSGA
jgi:hypothetical protein